MDIKINSNYAGKYGLWVINDKLNTEYCITLNVMAQCKSGVNVVATALCKIEFALQ